MNSASRRTEPAVLEEFSLRLNSVNEELERIDHDLNNSVTQGKAPAPGGTRDTVSASKAAEPEGSPPTAPSILTAWDHSNGLRSVAIFPADLPKASHLEGSIPVIGGSPDLEFALTEDQHLIEDHSDVVQKVCSATGRIEWAEGGEFTGTGFLLKIGGRVFVATCSHVIDFLREKHAMGFIPDARSLVINFGCEGTPAGGPNNSHVLHLHRFIRQTNQQPDFALFETPPWVAHRALELSDP